MKEYLNITNKMNSTILGVSMDNSMRSSGAKLKNAGKRNTLFPKSNESKNEMKHQSIIGIVSENFNEEPSEHMGSVSSRNSSQYVDISEEIVDTEFRNDSALKNMSRE